MLFSESLYPSIFPNFGFSGSYFQISLQEPFKASSITPFLAAIFSRLIISLKISISCILDLSSASFSSFSEHLSDFVCRDLPVEKMTSVQENLFGTFELPVDQENNRFFYLFEFSTFFLRYSSQKPTFLHRLLSRSSAGKSGTNEPAAFSIGSLLTAPNSLQIAFRRYQRLPQRLFLLPGLRITF